MRGAMVGGGQAVRAGSGVPVLTLPAAPAHPHEAVPAQLAHCRLPCPEAG